jgi:hypothetical protein
MLYRLFHNLVRISLGKFIFENSVIAGFEINLIFIVVGFMLHNTDFYKRDLRTFIPNWVLIK